MAFAHLHFHSEGSLLDGLARTKDAFDAVVEDGQSALAHTDHGTLGAIWKAKKAAREAGVKLVPGEEFYLALNEDGTLGSRFAPAVMETTDAGDDSDEDEGVKKKRYYHLTVLATSRTGWLNLIKVANASEHTKFGKYPMADLDLLAEHSEGLVILTGCLGGPVLGPAANGNIDLARRNLATLASTFGTDNVFVEVMEHGIRAETAVLPVMKGLADEAGLRLVATNDAHYVRAADAATHDAWLALRTKATLDDPARYRFTGTGYHLRTEAEMRSLFDADLPGDPSTLFDDGWLTQAIDALRSDILQPMLRPAEWDAEVHAEAAPLTDLYTQALDDALGKYGLAGESLEDAPHQAALFAAANRQALATVREAVAGLSEPAREFLARAAREQSMLGLFGRPSQNAAHPRNWWGAACDTSADIADRVAADAVPDGTPKLPKFPTPEGFKDNRGYLAHLVNEGATRLYGAERPKEVSDRLTYEWGVIDGMGFVDYFCIDHDFVSWAKSERCIHRPASATSACDVPDCPGAKTPILVGPGRGSAAGSLIAYCLGITAVDPLEHDLLFERFLEPGRADFPDIDIDFEQNRKEEVLDYLTCRWGEGFVALIGTYGISRSRRALRDAARLLDEQTAGNALCKLVPVVEGRPLPIADLLDEANEQTAEFRRELARQGEKGRRILGLALGFENVVNGASIHACGVVISDLYLPDLIPLRVHKNGRLITQWDSKDIESFGLIKFDVLAIRNLDILHTAMDYVHELTGERLTIDSIPHPSTQGDPRVDRAWELIRDGRTAGIFQMEGAAMTSLAQDVQPDGISDLSAILALFRPGPISAGMPEHFGARKNGHEAVDYGIYTADPAEQEAIATRLGNTYGILTFQEQLMLLGTTVAGFDTAMRSKLRKAIGKKDKDLMAQVKGVFLDGAEREFRDDDGNLISMVFRRDTAERLWAMFEGAASYAFNASHSYAYAYLAYWTAFMKANWPGPYGAAILANTSATETRVRALHALPAEGIEVLAPDVNLSGARSRPEGEQKVRIGLSEVSGVGGAGERVVAEREQGGAFRSVRDVAHRVRVDDLGAKHLPSNQLIGLIEAGALDEFGTRLGLTMVSRLATEELPAPVPGVEYGLIERAARQRARLGVSMGAHPLVVFQDQVRQWAKEVCDEDGNVVFKEHATPIGGVPTENGAPVTVIGLLGKWSEGSYSKGRKVDILLEGSSTSIEGVMWDRELGVQKELGIPPLGWPVAVSGKVTVREFEQEDEDGKVTIVTKKQLTVSRVDAVHIDDPLVGTVGGPVEVPNLTVGPDPQKPRRQDNDTPMVFAEPAAPDDEPWEAASEPDDKRLAGAVSITLTRDAYRSRLEADMRALGVDTSDLAWEPRLNTACDEYTLYRNGVEVVRLTLAL